MVLLDVRTREEYCRGHVCGAQLLATPLPPLTQSDKQQLADKVADALANHPKTAPVTIYCKKGIRAGVAAQTAQQLQFQNVQVLGGVNKDPLKSMIKAGQVPICYCQ